MILSRIKSCFSRRKPQISIGERIRNFVPAKYPVNTILKSTVTDQVFEVIDTPYPGRVMSPSGLEFYVLYEPATKTKWWKTRDVVEEGHLEEVLT